MKMHLRRPETNRRPLRPWPMVIGFIMSLALLGSGAAALPEPASAAVPSSVRGEISAQTPTLSGTLCVGRTLTAKPGNWLPSERTLSYQWLRNGRGIQDATGRDYTLATADLNTKISVRVRGDLEGSDSVERTSLEQHVAPCAIVPTRALVIAGAAKHGHKLRADSKWPAGVVTTYAWYRSGKAISKATKPWYKPTIKDIGRTITVKVTATKSGYTTYKTTAKAVKISKGSFRVMSAPKVSGTKKATHTLKASRGSYSPKPTSYSYQWYANGKKIKGATKSSYRLSGSQIGKRVGVKVTAKKAGYSSYAMESSAYKVGKAVFKLQTRPKISGTKKVGHTLKASKGTYSPRPTSYSYQWYRNGSPIKGATKSTYKVKLADEEYDITVKVKAKRTNYTSNYSISSRVYIPYDYSSDWEDDDDYGFSGGYSGYNGPRCYAPGGRTYTPC